MQWPHSHFSTYHSSWIGHYFPAGRVVKQASTPMRPHLCQTSVFIGDFISATSLRTFRDGYPKNKIKLVGQE